MNFTIEEINEAWLEFQKPLYYIGKKIKIADPENIGKFIRVDDVNSVQILEKQDFISFLISWKSKKKKVVK